jgi:hypothetical protein
MLSTRLTVVYANAAVQLDAPKTLLDRSKSAYGLVPEDGYP